jgi:hypothetical protein
MRASLRIDRVLAASMSAALLILVAACNDSNDVTGPEPVAVGADISGTWSGHYESNVPSLCSGGVDASATLTQSGNEVRGTLKASGCGIGGAFRGTVSGTYVTGRIEMLGCTGGAVGGSLEAGALTLDVGDFRKELVTGDAEVFPGGRVRLQR